MGIELTGGAGRGGGGGGGNRVWFGVVGVGGSLIEGGLSMDFIETEHPLTFTVVCLSSASSGSDLSSGVSLVGGRGVLSGGAREVSFDVSVGEVSSSCVVSLDSARSREISSI